MRYEADTHAHTTASGHAYSSVREMMQAAGRKGLKALALTEHAMAMPGTDVYKRQEQQYLPSEIEGSVFYRPTENGYEEVIRRYFERIHGK